MELRKDFRRVLSLEMIADDSDGYDEITPFFSAMRKIHEDSKKIGFINRFSVEERILLKGIWEKVKDDAQPIIEEANKQTGQGTRITRV